MAAGVHVVWLKRDLRTRDHAAGPGHATGGCRRPPCRGAPCLRAWVAGPPHHVLPPCPISMAVFGRHGRHLWPRGVACVLRAVPCPDAWTSWIVCTPKPPSNPCTRTRKQGWRGPSTATRRWRIGASAIACRGSKNRQLGVQRGRTHRRGWVRTWHVNMARPLAHPGPPSPAKQSAQSNAIVAVARGLAVRFSALCHPCRRPCWDGAVSARG